ncbi:MAG TPA: cupredoxin domain-containing protein [Chthoniobacterales bacterium]|nr:cupredoxin domain-containing protein [Chthoniobacterales bacterium]
MNTKNLLTAVLACSLCFTVAQAEEKTVGEKSAEVWDETKKKTKEVSKAVVKTTKETSRAVVKKTKETVKAIEHSIDTPDADARKVEVTITDTGVQMPRSLRAGKTAFIVANSGKQKHNFEIEGENLDKSFWFAIAPKDSKTMQVDLKPGTYEAHCSVDEHAGKEARVKLAVK